MLPLLDQGHHLFLDNWYSSAQLFTILHNLRTTATGTVRANRSPAALRQARVVKGGPVQSFSSGKVLAQKFFDKKEVSVLSTGHKAQGTAPKVPCVLDYNKYMGAVDRQDQMLEPYDATRKTLKWYKKLAIRFVQIAVECLHSCKEVRIQVFIPDIHAGSD